MYSGWFKRWPINRAITKTERDAVLKRGRVPGWTPDDRGTLTAFNSTYAEFVGRRFRLRGGIGMTIFILFPLWMVGFAAYAWVASPPTRQDLLIGDLTISFLAIIVAVGLWWLIFSKEFCTHTYYPIRFNRKTRQIYVFRDKRDGGILTMPWEQGFFHVGKGLRDKQLLDLRCHILDGDTVKDTFVTGGYYLPKEYVEQIWQFVQTYMDEGPDQLGEVVIWNSAKPNFRNCMLIAGTNIGAITRALTIVLFPFTVLLASMRWLVLSTCKAPAWPAEIEMACAIDANDPHRLPEPDYVGEFVKQWLEAHPHWNDGSGVGK
jgi:Family of unknown function (DUF6708)